MSIWDEIEGVGEDIVDAGSDVGEALVAVGSDLLEGPGELVGVATAGAALFVVGPAAVIPAFIAGAAAGNALIKHRGLSAAETAMADEVFGPTLPSADRIVLTNLTGLEGHKFTCPNATGQVLLNIGEAYDDPIHYEDQSYPGPGKVFIHEMTHAWQIHHSSFVPGLVCEGIGNQLAKVPYQPGPGGRPWVDYNLEQQATIVDEWFFPASRGPKGFRPMRPEHPFFRYVEVDIRGGILSRSAAMTGSGQSLARVSDHLDVFWTGKDGFVESQWYDSAVGCNWSDHQPFRLSTTEIARSGSQPVTVSRRPDHVDAFWVTPDGAIASQWWNQAPGLSWGDHPAFRPAPAGAARADSPVAAVGQSTEHLDAFWIGVEGAVTSTWWDSSPGAGWGDHEPFPITGPAAAGQGSGLSVLSRQEGQLDVFWVDADGAIATHWWHAGAGTNWGDHQAFATTRPRAAVEGSPVVATARSASHLDVFWISPDGAVASTWWDAAPGGGWKDHAAFPVTVPATAAEGSGLAVVSRRPDWLDLFWVGGDGAIGTMWWGSTPGGNWSEHDSFTITDRDAAAPGSPVTAVARGANHLDVFWIGRGGDIMTTWWDATPGQGWADHRPFAITPLGAAGPVLVGWRLDKTDLTRRIGAPLSPGG